MDWSQVAALFLANSGLILWMRSESRADWKHSDQKLDSSRELIHAIHLEMKDFHNKLIELEREVKGLPKK